jgi:hypothetical protein
VEGNIAHRHPGREPRMVRPRLLLPMAPCRKHQKKSEARSGNSQVPGRLHRAAIIAQRECELRRERLTAWVHAQLSSEDSGSQALVIRAFCFAVPEKRMPQV